MLIYYDRMIINNMRKQALKGLRAFHQQASAANKMSTSGMQWQRPISVAVIAWIEIVGGIAAQAVFAVASFVNPRHIAALVQSRVPFGVQTALSEIGILIMVTSGIGMLKGANWARSIYIAWAGLALVRAVTLFEVTPQQLVIFVVGCAKYVTFIYFLTGPNANRFFQGNAQKLFKFRTCA